MRVKLGASEEHHQFHRTVIVALLYGASSGLAILLHVYHSNLDPTKPSSLGPPDVQQASCTDAARRQLPPAYFEADWIPPRAQSRDCLRPRSLMWVLRLCGGCGYVLNRLTHTHAPDVVFERHLSVLSSD